MSWLVVWWVGWWFGGLGGSLVGWVGVEWRFGRLGSGFKVGLANSYGEL